jgi:beta-glucosidase
VLPLQVGQLSRVAVLGPNAADTRTLGGGSATVFAPYTISFLDGLRAALSEHVRVDHVGGVRATDRLPSAPLDMLFVPGTDEPGLLVRFLSPDGVELGTETRKAAAFTWNNLVLPGVRVRDVGQVEVHTRLRAAREGRHLIGASAVGPAQLLLDGRLMLDEVISLPAGADPVEGLMRPPQRSVALTMREGEEVDVQLRYVTGASEAFGGADIPSINLQLNVALHQDEDEELAAAVALAGSSDVAIVVVGTSEEVESEGFDRDSLALPGRQDELVRAVLTANPRTVVVVNSGAPVLLPWADDVPAILAAWFPGQEAGHALADVLTGVVEPGGRLPTTWPVDETAPLPAVIPQDGRLPYDEGLHIGHRGYERAGVEPRYWLGHGLGYTTWDYLSANVALTDSGGARVLVRVRNTGARTGREVVQVYLSRPDSTLDRPARWLAGFGAATAAPGGDADVSIDIPERAFAHWYERGWTVEPGVFRLIVGRSAADTVLTVRVHKA